MCPTRVGRVGRTSCTDPQQELRCSGDHQTNTDRRQAKITCGVPVITKQTRTDFKRINKREAVRSAPHARRASKATAKIQRQTTNELMVSKCMWQKRKTKKLTQTKTQHDCESLRTPEQNWSFLPSLHWAKKHYD